MVEISFLGHSSFRLKWANKTVFTDLWLSLRPREVQRLVPPATTQEKIKEADALLVSHEHFDHCDPFDVSMVAGRTFAHVVAPEDSMAHLQDVNPRQKVSVREGDSFTLSGVEITVTPAKHPQSTYPVGYIIAAGDKTVYFAGDTYEFYDMVNLDVDLAILPIGGTFTMDVLGAIKALKQMRAKYVVPMHYDTFPRIDADVNDFEKRVRSSTRSTPIILEPGQRFEL